MKKRLTRMLTVGLWVWAGLSAQAGVAATTEGWPGWGGPRGDRTAVGDGVFDGGAFGLTAVWNEPLGPGYSGVSVDGGRVVTAFSDGESDLLGAFERETGKELWRYDLGATYAGHDGSDDGPLATPTLDRGAVFFLAPHGKLVALSLSDGAELWSHDLATDLGAREPDYGFTSSPLVVGDVLVVQAGGDEGRSILGFDRAAGERLWSVSDDRVGYQSPAVMELAGLDQVVAVTNRQLLGLDPRSGETLWSHDLAEDDSDDGFAHPVRVGDSSVLLTTWGDAGLYRVLSNDGLYAVEEVWRKNSLRGGHAIPVYWDGYLYGFAGSFLTCVDPATGEAVWKSRPPGSGMLIAVNGHLVIQTEAGELVVAEASPKGYVEKARASIFERGYPTAPSFADGRIYARNIARLASLSVNTRIGPAEAPGEVAEATASGVLADWVKRIEAAEEKQPVIDELLAAHDSFPVVEGKVAHFVFQGEVPDLVVSGNFSRRGDLPMARVDGTDFYYRSVEVEPESIYVYGFNVFDEFRPDPLNGARAGEGDGAGSILTTEGWEERAYLAASPGRRGAIESYQWASELLENERDVSIYLPVGYSQSEERYPLLVVQLGDQALAQGKMSNALDHLIGERIEPVVVAFVPRRHWAEYAGSRPDVYSEALATELIPHLEATYRIDPDPMRRGSVGVGSGAFVSLFASFHGDLFGRAGTQSFYHGDKAEELMAAIRAAEPSERKFFIGWSRRDYLDEGNGLDALEQSRAVAALLAEKGYETIESEVGHGPGWEGWSADFDRMLETLYPMP